MPNAPTDRAASAPPAPRVGLSACIITFNEADRIGDCLASLAFCDEIVVVDSFSSDATVAIAEAAGARVLQRPFDGFRSQKAFCVEQAGHDWVLCLDADERVDEVLRTSILAVRDAGFADGAGYRFARLSEYFGRYLRHGTAYPDRILRLFDRRRGGGRGGGGIHETARGKRATAAKLVFAPAWRFVRGYVLKAGFRDGWPGLIESLVSANYVRQKTIMLWLLQHGQPLVDPPPARDDAP